MLSSASLIVVINLNWMDELWDLGEIIKYTILAAVARVVILFVIMMIASKTMFGLALEALICLYFLFIFIRGIFWISRGKQGRKLNAAGAREYDSLRNEILQKGQKQLEELNEKYGKREEEIAGSIRFASAEELEGWFTANYEEAG